ncbi:Ig-like domain-containing protein [Sodaliphilus sp.]|uniref:Ig-like domain-containing protein n=1 Tax=Sodaliphilus sp. TaxID=2815818 RepID=UPI00388E6C15
MKRFIINLSLAVMAMLLPLDAAGARHAVDFNHPKQMSKTALADLKRAQKTGDGEMTVDALMRYSLAQSFMDASNSNINDIIARIEQVSRQETHPGVKALLLMLEAHVLQAYSEEGADGLKEYYREDQDDSPAPADYRLWSKKDFDTKTAALYDEVLAMQEPLALIPVTAYPRVIKTGKMGATLVPTLLQFACQKIYEYHLIFGDSRIDPVALWLESTRDNTPAHIHAMIETYKYSTDDYEHYRENEHSARFLLEPVFRDKQKKYSLLRDYIARFPDSYYKAQVYNEIHDLEAPSVSLSFPSRVKMGEKIKVKALLANTDRFTLNIRQKDSDTPLRKIEVKMHEPAGKIPYTIEEEIEVDALPGYGNYVITPSLVAGGKEYTNKLEHWTKVSDIACNLLERNDSHEVIVMDAYGGAPIVGAKVTEIPHKLSADKENAVTAITDSMGRASFSCYPKNTLIVGTGSEEHHDDFRTVICPLKPRNMKEYFTDIFTDQSYYTAGEDAKWMLVASGCVGHGYTPFSNKELQVVLWKNNEDNDEAIDSVTVMTDATGRASGAFAMPAINTRKHVSFYIEVSDRGQKLNRKDIILIPGNTRQHTSIDMGDNFKHFGCNDSINLGGKIISPHGTATAPRTVEAKCMAISENDVNTFNTQVETDERGNFNIGFPDEFIAERNSTSGKAQYLYVLQVQCPGDKDVRSNCVTFTVGDVETEPTQPAATALDSLLWCPAKLVKPDASDVAHIKVMSGVPQASVLCIVASDSAIISCKWLQLKQGENTVDVPVPHDRDVRVEFAMHHDMEFYDRYVYVERNKRLLTVTPQPDPVFTAGEHGKLTFTVTDQDGNPVQAAMTIEVINKTEEYNIRNLQLADSNTSDWMRFMHYNLFSNSSACTITNQITLNKALLKPTYVTCPKLYEYGQDMFEEASEDVCTDDDYTDDATPCDPSQCAIKAGGYPSRSDFRDHADSQPEATPSPYQIRVRGAGSALTAIFGHKATPERVQKMLVSLNADNRGVKTMLWEPLLTTDAEGKVTVEFDAPSFDGHWIVKGFVHDQFMNSTPFTHEIITRQKQ